MRSASERPSAPVRSPPSAVTDDPPRGFSSLLQHELAFVWRVLRRLGLSRADADDAAQQVFLVTARKGEQVLEDKKRKFLYGTALRVAANTRRGIKRRREVQDEAVLARQSAGPTPYEVLERQRERALLDELLAELPEPLRRALVLSDVEQLTLAEIAELEGIPAGTAASRLRRARAAFRERLAAHPQAGAFASRGSK